VSLDDENIVVGATSASAGKTSITDYGSLDSIGQKLAKKRFYNDMLNLFHLFYLNI